MNSKKTIGLIGGLSPESTVDYYRLINRETTKQLGPMAGADILTYNVNLAHFYDLMRRNAITEAERLLSNIAKKLERGGADFIVIACNTAHVAAEAIQNAVKIPLIHIADVLAESLKKDGIKRPALLGSNFTMEASFYHHRLRYKHQIEMLIPQGPDRQDVAAIIFNELCTGQIRKSSKRRMLEVIHELANGQGADAVVLGCTELGLLISQDDLGEFPVYDTTILHTNRIVALSIGSTPLPRPDRMVS